MVFLNRKDELKFLQKQNNHRPSLVILYGRRRVGKTALVQKFCQKQNKNCIYYTASETNAKDQIKEAFKLIGKTINDKGLRDLKRSWRSLLRYLKDKNIIFVIDEFPYLIKSDKSILSKIQRLWDNELKESNIFLILTGSAVSMMEDRVLSHNSPLYGRKTGQWKLEPFKFYDSYKFSPEYSIKNQIRAYSILGGIPYFLEQFKKDKDLFQNIQDQILSKGSVLYNEPEFLMRIEFREPKNYYTILKSISKGNTEFNQIKTNTGITKNNLTSYLSTLRNLDIIKRRTPITRKKSKKGKYYLEDNYIKFWFKYILPNKSQLEINKTTILNKIKKDIDKHTSHTFEDICREYITKKSDYKGYEVGRWWYKGNEIDIVGLNQDKREILFGECKWRNKKTGYKTLNNLKIKSEKVRWRKDNRTEKYVLFSKNGYSQPLKNNEEENVELLTLRDLEDFKEALK